MGRIGDGLNYPESGVWTLKDVYRYFVGEAPAVVRSAALWLDAADLSTITQSSGQVSQWNNKGTLGNFTQATAASQPTTGVGTLNGLNVINFAADFLTSADTAATYKFLHDGTDYLISAVVKFGTVANPNVLMAFMDNGGLDKSFVGFTLAYDDRGSVPRNNATIHQTANASGNSATAFPISNIQNDTILPNAFSIATILGDPDDATAADRSKIFVNGGSVVAANTKTNASSASNPRGPLNIGTFQGIATFELTGSIAEIVVVSGADATETNRVIIRNYLNAKWDVF